MMMNDPKKKITTIIAGLGKSAEAPKNEMGDEMDSSMGLMSAAEDMLLAVKENSPKRLMEAMKAFVQMQMDEPSEEPSESEE